MAGNCYVYIAFRLDGSPCYVGKGSRGRWRVHLNRSHNRQLRGIICRAGGDIPIVVIRSGLSQDKAFEIETAFIRAIGRFPHGPLVNMTDGGDGPSGVKQSNETIQKRVAKLKGQKRTAEQKERISKAIQGRRVSDSHISALRNYPRTAAGRARMRAAKLGKKQTAEQIEARIAPLRGRKRSPEECAKVSAGKLGKKASEKTKAILRAANRSREPAVRDKIRAGVLRSLAERRERGTEPWP